jgi:hypothetical protein
MKRKITLYLSIIIFAGCTFHNFAFFKYIFIDISDKYEEIDYAIEKEYLSLYQIKLLIKLKENKKEKLLLYNTYLNNIKTDPIYTEAQNFYNELFSNFEHEPKEERIGLSRSLFIEIPQPLIDYREICEIISKDPSSEVRQNTELYFNELNKPYSIIKTLLNDENDMIKRNVLYHLPELFSCKMFKEELYKISLTTNESLKQSYDKVKEVEIESFNAWSQSLP